MDDCTVKKNGMNDKLKNIAQRCLRNDNSCHDWDHTLRVLRNALYLARKEGADEAVVEAAALLHDIARPQETESRGEIDHAALGAKMAAEILRNNQIGDEAFRKAVIQCIATHRYRSRSGIVPPTLEAKVLYDADKLDSLGAVGLARSLHFAGHTGARIHNTEDEALSGEPYGREDSAYREYLVKLRHLPEAMLTQTGAKLAQERLDFMTEFFKQLTIECGEEIY